MMRIFLVSIIPITVMTLPVAERITRQLRAQRQPRNVCPRLCLFRRMLPRLGPITNGKTHGQKASYFCLENQHWRIIALDTGYDSIGWPLLEYVFQPACPLRPEQIDWLRTVVRPRDDDPRGIILLTHQQYYSAYDNWYPQPARQLAEFFSRPVLWFWGTSIAWRSTENLAFAAAFAH